MTLVSAAKDNQAATNGGQGGTNRMSAKMPQIGVIDSAPTVRHAAALVAAALAAGTGVNARAAATEPLRVRADTAYP